MVRSLEVMSWVADSVASKVLVRRTVNRVPIQVEKSPMTGLRARLAKDIRADFLGATRAHLLELETEVLKIVNWSKKSSMV